MVNIFGRRGSSRPSSFSAKSLGQRRGTAIVSQPEFRESGDCEPCAEAFSDEYGATPPPHHCPIVARRRIQALGGTDWEREQTSMAGKRNRMGEGSLIRAKCAMRTSGSDRSEPLLFAHRSA
jgi:hypothetical protein